ncbi:Uncharacterized protein TCM_006148 [Theobroma cacao]|uniref:Uncharacterized protein n=1 Tax=Theobroma cacao TaxID=3641 RepID=A0A061E419_THECC|nr:Uncharacterized protein TCM_006148 [Theobroma cacao]
MTEISRRRSLRFLLLFALVSLQFISGFSDDSTSSKNSSKTKSNASSYTGTKLFEEDDELEVELGLRD